MSEEMMSILNERIDLVTKNQKVRDVMIKMKNSGSSDEEIKSFVYNIAVGSLLFGELN
ncbi:hypothetical protein ZPAH1_orf00120 [Aeromonas phage ZPAH1]|nr:hypothetical protein ASwh1_72 [Aeromonas phage Aswh_1]QQG33882.1 hypothetical protein ZPAH1_orf00120 [Aeromonas phage ZPAH1]